MKYYALIAIMLLGILSLGACGESDDPITPDHSSNDLPDIESPVELDQDVMVINDGSERATVTLEKDGYVANYGDFNIKYKKPEMENGQVVAVGFSEWTSTDHLDVRVELLGYRHQLETYTRGDQVLQLEIVDEMTDSQIEQLTAFLNDPSKSENSVMDNPDGHVLAALLEENWDDVELAIDTSPDKRPGWADFVCGVATACVATKCWLGGLLNTGCGVCTSTVAACAIMDAFGWW